MSSLFQTLILLLPGFTTLYWIEAWTSRSARVDTSEAEKTLRGFMLSLPVMTITWAILIGLHGIAPHWIGAVYTVPQLAKGLDNIDILLTYVILNLGVGYAFARVWIGWIGPWFNKLLNKTRGKTGRGNLGEYDRVWDELFQGSENQVIAIQRFGDAEPFLYGIVDTVSNLDNNEKAFKIIGSKEVEELKERLAEPLYVYTDFSQGVLIRVYDPDVLLG